MPHTEAEAAKLWCPMVRLVELGSGGKDYYFPPLNRFCETGYGAALSPDDCRCIASDCAMWRWDHDARRIVGDPAGYCGLAGKPA